MITFSSFFNILAEWSNRPFHGKLNPACHCCASGNPKRRSRPCSSDCRLCGKKAGPASGGTSLDSCGLLLMPGGHIAPCIRLKCYGDFFLLMEILLLVFGGFQRTSKRSTELQPLSYWFSRRQEPRLRPCLPEGSITVGTRFYY